MKSNAPMPAGRCPQSALPPEVREEIRADRTVFDACLDHLRARAAGPAEGVYGPASVTWLVFREAAVSLGGLRAIALQIAHPAVAHGVSRSSRFADDLLSRARRTFSSMNQLIFGDLESALASARRIHNLHDRVRGTRDAGESYRANDPRLLLWVLATLFDTSLRVYGALVRPLTLEEQRRFYDEASLSGALFGIPPASMPPSLEAFHAYYDAMLAGDELRAGDDARGLARTLFSSPYSGGPLGAAITAGLLPPRWRDAFGLPWRRREQLAHAAAMAALRRVLARTPPALRFVPAYHQAQRRIGSARAAADLA